MALLRIVVWRAILCCWHCLGSRDPPPTPTSPDAPGALQLDLEDSPPPAKPALSMQKDSPSLDELDRYIAAEGPLEKKLQAADLKAGQLAVSAEEWSDTSGDIRGPMHNVVNEATKDAGDLEKASATQRSDAEAEVEHLLREAENAIGTEEQQQLEIEGKAADEKVSEAQDEGRSLVSLAALEHHFGISADDGSTDTSSTDSPHGQIEELLKSAEANEKEEQDASMKWASQPQEELKHEPQDAYEVVDDSPLEAGSTLQHGKQ